MGLIPCIELFLKSLESSFCSSCGTILKITVVEKKSRLGDLPNATAVEGWCLNLTILYEAKNMRRSNVTARFVFFAKIKFAFYTIEPLKDFCVLEWSFSSSDFCFVLPSCLDEQTGTKCLLPNYSQCQLL